MLEMQQPKKLATIKLNNTKWYDSLLIVGEMQFAIRNAIYEFNNFKSVTK